MLIKENCPTCFNHPRLSAPRTFDEIKSSTELIGFQGWPLLKITSGQDGRKELTNTVLKTHCHCRGQTGVAAC